MRSAMIALRVVGAATGFLILAPVPGTAFAEEKARLTDTVHALGAEPGSDLGDGDRSGAVERLQIVTLMPPSRSGAESEAEGKQGEEENAEREREGHDGKKDDGSQDGRKDDGSKDGKWERDGGEGEKDGEGRDHGGGSDGDHDGGHDADHDGGRDGDRDDDGSDEHGSDEEDVEAPDPAETPVAPVSAGGGGAADRLASPEAKSADTQGPGTPHTVIGLLLAGAAAVAVAFRSARRRRAGSPDRD